MKNGINSKTKLENKRTMNARLIMERLEDLQDGKFYRVADLQKILQNLGLNYSIYTIRDYETYKCLNYECGKRFNDTVDKCGKCGGKVRAPIIESPRTRGGGKGVGHRRYTGADIKKTVEVFKQRN